MFDTENQIILGTLLGTSRIVGGKLLMRNSNKDWLKSKIFSLSNYDFDLFKKGRYFYANSGFYLHFKDFYDKIRFEKSHISFFLLDHLRDVAISVWYGDSGCLVGRTQRNACLRTQPFGKNGNRVIVDWFNSVGIACDLNKHRNSNVVVFSLSGSKLLFDMVAPLLPKNRYHLLPFS